MHGSTRAFQIAFLALLVVSFAQATWWIFEETRHSADVRDRQIELYTADAAAAEDLLRAGTSPQRVQALFPHLDVLHDGVIFPGAIAALDKARSKRLNRFGWEGSFFLLVLLCGMGVILQALRQNQALLRRQQNFLASASHELKSPLASLRLAAETMLLRRPEPETVERLARRIVLDAARLETLVSNLLAADRLEEGEIDLIPTTQAVGPLVENALREVDAELAEVEVKLELMDDVTVHTDPEAFRACLRNLLTNAAKAIAAGDGRQIHIAARRTGARTEIVVTDDGIGFEAREAARLFDKFYRPGDEMRRRTKGSGLGLYIVKHFAKLSPPRSRPEATGPAAARPSP